MLIEAIIALILSSWFLVSLLMLFKIILIILVVNSTFLIEFILFWSFSSLFSFNPYLTMVTLFLPRVIISLMMLTIVISMPSTPAIPILSALAALAS